MKTMFKIFKIEWNISKLERIIKRYQEELRLEVKSVVVLRNYEDGDSIGVIFEKTEFKGKESASSEHAITAFAPPEEAV